jgi:hypothetical protein
MEQWVALEHQQVAVVAEVEYQELMVQEEAHLELLEQLVILERQQHQLELQHFLQEVQAVDQVVEEDLMEQQEMVLLVHLDFQGQPHLAAVAEVVEAQQEEQLELDLVATEETELLEEMELQ